MATVPTVGGINHPLISGNNPITETTKTDPVAVKREAYDKELRMKSLLYSIYTSVQGQYNTEKKTVPNAIYMKVGKGVLSDGSSAVIQMKYPLRQPGVFGSEIAVGREEGVELKKCEIFRNNCRKVVAVMQYGIEKLDYDYLDLFKKHVDDLAVWNKEQEDLEIHQALLETFGETLWYGDTAAMCPRTWNPNIYIAGAGPVSFTGTPTAAELRTAMDAAPNSGEGTILTSDVLTAISNYALAKRIERLDLDVPGGKGYILTISELQAAYLGDPAWSARNLGSLFTSVASLSDRVMKWPGVIGSFKDLLIVVDVRASTVRRTAEDGTPLAAGNVNAGYMYHGDRDARGRGLGTTSTTSTRTMDAAVIHGKGALVKWEPEPLHSIQQLEDYAKIKGVGTACVRGIQIPIYRNGASGIAPQPGTAFGLPVTPAIEQFSSAVVLCGIPTSGPVNGPIVGP